jgi:predicted pyridoxine 5'-phosphate oxidase superfamily flavin-nucleotide-binding protein
MGRVLECIDQSAREFIAAQHMFFVATAPSGTDGHVNISPKGHADTFVVVDDHTVAYLDLTGSGAETAAHLRDNGRITLMFCGFDGGPNILRLFGTGRVVTDAMPDYAELVALFPFRDGARAVVLVDVNRVSTSCGFAVPYYSYDGERDLLEAWAGSRSPERLRTYRNDKNVTSIDGLPAFDRT